MPDPRADYKVEIVGDPDQADMKVFVVNSQSVDLTNAAPGDVLTVQEDGTIEASVSGTNGAGTVSIPADAKAYSQTNFDSVSYSSAKPKGYTRFTSGAQNAEVVFGREYFEAGTYVPIVVHFSGTNRGIYTVSISEDAAAWTDIGTVDGYAASGIATRSEVAAVSIAEGRYFVRLKMATKNASSSSYLGDLTEVMFTRTGDPT